MGLGDDDAVRFDGNPIFVIPEAAPRRHPIYKTISDYSTLVPSYHYFLLQEHLESDHHHVVAA